MKSFINTYLPVTLMAAAILIFNKEIDQLFYYAYKPELYGSLALAWRFFVIGSVLTVIVNVTTCAIFWLVHKRIPNRD